MFETVIWATDGSAAADLGLPYATELASGAGAKLVVVHCKELLVGRAGGVPALADEPQIQGKIRAQVAGLQDASVDVSLRIVTAAASSAPHAIADVARDTAADVIVVGTRGHSALAGLLLGSVTQRLLHIAPCPVLAVPAASAATLDERTRARTLSAS
jgi:nucleotide-binding universal stress UspA family protein